MDVRPRVERGGFAYHDREGQPSGGEDVSMRIELYGLMFETPAVTYYMWSTWRASFLEHRLFDAIRQLPSVEMEKKGDEVRATITDAKAWRASLQAISRILKGWQEEAESGAERRTWRWLLEADVDFSGYDHAGDRASLWGFLRLSMDRGTQGMDEKGEDIDLNDFGLQIWPEEDKR